MGKSSFLPPITGTCSSAIDTSGGEGEKTRVGLFNLISSLQFLNWTLSWYWMGCPSIHLSFHSMKGVPLILGVFLKHSSLEYHLKKFQCLEFHQLVTQGCRLLFNDRGTQPRQKYYRCKIWRRSQCFLFFSSFFSMKIDNEVFPSVLHSIL